MTEPGGSAPRLRHVVGRAGKAVQKIMPKNASTTTATSAGASTPAADAMPAGVPGEEPEPTAGGKKTPAKKTSASSAVGGASAKAQPKKPGKAARSAKAAKPKKSTRTAPPVPEGTDWSAVELAEVRTDLETQLTELRSEYDQAIADLSDLQQTSNDGAGDDQADAGTKTFEREQEMSIAHNRLDLLTQMERAIERIEAGTYGRCESCGNPITKARLQAFPSATLCVVCKQREERR